MELGDRLRLFITHNWGTLNNFMFELRVNSASLHKYLKGTGNPSLPFLKQLHSAGCSIDWLLTGEGEMYNDTPAGQTLREKSSTK